MNQRQPGRKEPFFSLLHSILVQVHVDVQPPPEGILFPAKVFSHSIVAKGFLPVARRTDGLLSLTNRERVVFQRPHIPELSLRERERESSQVRLEPCSCETNTHSEKAHQW